MDSISELRLIPEFDGASSDVVEWVEKFEMVCRLRGIRDMQNVIPLRLTGGAFAVYLQLSEAQKTDYKAVKTALVSAFASDGFIAFEEFVGRKLRDGESVDVYLSDLRRLAALIGGLPEKALMFAFVAGLPDNTHRLLRADHEWSQWTCNRRWLELEPCWWKRMSRSRLRLLHRPDQLRLRPDVRGKVTCRRPATPAMNPTISPATVGCSRLGEVAGRRGASDAPVKVTSQLRARETAAERRGQRLPSLPIGSTESAAGDTDVCRGGAAARAR